MDYAMVVAWYFLWVILLVENDMEIHCLVSHKVVTMRLSIVRVFPLAVVSIHSHLSRRQAFLVVSVEATIFLLFPYMSGVLIKT